MAQKKDDNEDIVKNGLCSTLLITHKQFEKRDHIADLKQKDK